MKIEISIDTPEAEEFARWLNANGHDAVVGTTTGDFVGGVWTSGDDEACEVMRDLWERYCNQDLTAAAGRMVANRVHDVTVKKAVGLDRPSGAKWTRTVQWPGENVPEWLTYHRTKADAEAARNQIGPTKHCR